jgi:hypothetical protein
VIGAGLGFTIAQGAIDRWLALVVPIAVMLLGLAFGAMAWGIVAVNRGRCGTTRRFVLPSRAGVIETASPALLVVFVAAEVHGSVRAGLERSVLPNGRASATPSPTNQTSCASPNTPTSVASPARWRAMPAAPASTPIATTGIRERPRAPRRQADQQRPEAAEQLAVGAGHARRDGLDREPRRWPRGRVVGVQRHDGLHAEVRDHAAGDQHAGPDECDARRDAHRGRRGGAQAGVQRPGEHDEHDPEDDVDRQVGELQATEVLREERDLVERVADAREVDDEQEVGNPGEVGERQVERRCGTEGERGRWFEGVVMMPPGGRLERRTDLQRKSHG